MYLVSRDVPSDLPSVSNQLALEDNKQEEPCSPNSTKHKRHFYTRNSTVSAIDEESVDIDYESYLQNEILSSPPNVR